MPSRIASRALAAVARGQAELRRRQSAAGAWRDFDLPPGASDAWTTAFVGCALLREPAGLSPADPAIVRAADAILALRREQGWSYNRDTACDGDSTAFALRFLALARRLGDLSAADILSAYLGADGNARTFLSADRFGSWVGGSAEVTPAAGLALLEAGAARTLIATVCAAVARTGSDGQGWTNFWWDTPAYALACNLEFLARTGTVPRHLARRAHAAIDALAAVPSTAFACAQLLGAASLAGHPAAAALLARLLAMQEPEGAWPPSLVLRVPAQFAPFRYTLHADERQIFGTAAAIGAIKLFVLAGGAAAWKGLERD